MIIATAGHIDHGKTSLVKALTGIDADRLPEEKARGITVDLGFAYQQREGQTLGFVDVPGHEKLVRTMVAGATGVDCALLVVAADDGVMPQTREHLAILDLLGLDRGFVAITKSDRVDALRLASVADEVRALLAGTALADAAILPCSARTGTGIAELAAQLDGSGAASKARHAAAAGFRLAIDRSFRLQGVGLIVTGAVHSGSVRIGDRLILSPGGQELRVRGIRAQDRDADIGRAGERCALNVVGPRLSREDIHRGNWIVAPDLHAPASRLDARLRLLGSETKALRHRTPVQVHLGAAAVTGRVLLLDERPLQPGEDALAQVALDAPIGALSGDRFVLRDISAQRTLGGGRVIDPFGPRRGMRTPQRRAMLDALSARDDAQALSAAMRIVEGGLDLDHFRRIRNLEAEAEARLLAETGIVVVPGPNGRLGFTSQQIAFLRDSIGQVLDAAHSAEPDNPGLTFEELATRLPKGVQPAIRTALQALVQDDGARRRGNVYHRPGHVVRLGPIDLETWAQIRDIQQGAGLDQLRIAHLAEKLKLEPDELRPLLDKLGRIGWLRRLSKSYYVLPEAAFELARIAEDVAAEHPDGLLTVGRFREATGIGRNMTMPVLEHFDAVGFTLRINDGRRVRGDRRTIFSFDEVEPASG